MKKKNVFILLIFICFASGCFNSHKEEIRISRECIDYWETNRGNHFSCSYHSSDDDLFKGIVVCNLDNNKRDYSHIYNTSKYKIGITKNDEYVLGASYYLYGEEKYMILDNNCSIKKNNNVSKSNNNMLKSNYNSVSNKVINSNINSNVVVSNSNKISNSNIIKESNINSNKNEKKESTSNKQVNSNKVIKPKLDVYIGKKLNLDEVEVSITTDLEGISYNLYLNNKKVISNGKLHIGTSGYTDYTEVDNIQVGNNSIKVDLIKDGKVVNTITKNYTLSLSNIPTPKLHINTTFNTYDDNYDFLIFTDKNECYGSKCTLVLYVNGVKQPSISQYRPNLQIGDNVFKFELKNLYGKSDCKLVTVKRFEKNPEVNFTQLGNINIVECN